MPRRWRGLLRIIRVSALFFLLVSAEALESSSSAPKSTDPANLTDPATAKVETVSETATKSTAKETISERKDITTERITMPMVAAKNAPVWRGGKISSKKDSYLEALSYSRYTHNNNKDKLVRMDSNPIRVSSNRREYAPGPVYVPQTEYGTVKVSSEGYQSEKSPEKSSKVGRGVYSPPDHSYEFSIQPSESYSLPTKSSSDFQHGPNGYRSSYDSPRIVYGPPHKSQPPQHSYTEYSGPTYLSPQPAYGPPSSSYGPPSVPYTLPEFQLPQLPSIDFAWPFALKLNVFTLAKILLKLVIFKMIVKFIAVICLLLFIPKLKIIKKGNMGGMMEDEEEEEEGRRFFPENGLSFERLNALTSLVLSSYERQKTLNNERSSSDESCTDLSCYLRKSFAFNDTWSDYARILKSYASEELEKTKA